MSNVYGEKAPSLLVPQCLVLASLSTSELNSFHYLDEDVNLRKHAYEVLEDGRNSAR